MLILSFLLACRSADPPGGRFAEGGFSVAIDWFGPDGGSMTLADGSVLTVPPGALAEEHELLVAYPEALAAADPGYRIWIFEPDGLEFAVPVEFDFPLPAGADALLIDGVPAVAAYHIGGANEPVDLGSELSLYGRVDLDVGPTRATARLDHFSVFEAVAEVDELAYIVTDIPPKYLDYGDVYFTLTKMGIPLIQGEKEGPNWAPGHVAILAPQTGFGDRIIEAVPDAGVQHAQLSGFNTDPGHLTLGAHRPVPPLSAADRIAIRTWLEDQLGASYAATYGFGDILGYSCVGLAEKMLDQVDRGAHSPWLELTAALGVLTRPLPQSGALTAMGVMGPLALHRTMRPVRRFQVFAGELVRVPIHGARVDDASFAPSETPPWEFYCACDHELVMASLPTHAAFVPHEGRAGAGVDFSVNYLLTWQTYPEDAGRTVDFPIEMRFELDLRGARVPVVIRDTLTVEVVGISGPTVTVVVFERDVPYSPTDFVPAGSVIRLDRLTNGVVSGPDGGCDSLHLHGTGVVLDQELTLNDPNPTGCGYGRIVEYPEELVE